MHGRAGIIPRDHSKFTSETVRHTRKANNLPGILVQAAGAGTILVVSTDAAVSRTATQPASVTGSGFVLL